MSVVMQDIPNEVDVRLRLHDCYCQLKMFKDAIQVVGINFNTKFDQLYAPL